MNISKEQIDDLNAVVTIKVGPEDYTDRFEKAVKKIQQQMAMPGFRPGKVPTGLIKKRYGKSILLEELNKVLSDSLNNYIVENKLDILGNPLPKTSEESLDLETQKEFSFSFELGLSPSFDVDLSSKVSVPYEEIQVDDELVEKYLKDVRKNYGKHINPETSGEKDVIFADIVELDENGNIVPGGIFKSTSIGIDRLTNESARKKLTGLKKDDKVVINVRELYPSSMDIEISLGVEKERAENLNCDVQLTIKNIARLEDAELNQELFDKIYGEGKVTTEEEFKNKIREELGIMFVRDTDRKFFNEAQEKLISMYDPKLPDEFLKKWLLTANENPVTPEQIEKDYAAWSKMMKWKLIENKIARQHNISVTQEEMKEEARRYILDQYRRYGQEPNEQELDKISDSILSKEGEARKIADNILDRKMLELFKGTMSLDKKQVSYNDFFGIKEEK